MTWFGILSYERYFFDYSWRLVFLVCAGVNIIIGLLQVCLTTGKSREWGIPDLWFALGDDGVQEFLIGIQFLPLCIMYLGMCPEGSEGTTYAMLTTFSNLAGTIAFDISTLLTLVWSVDEDTLVAGDFIGERYFVCNIFNINSDNIHDLAPLVTGVRNLSLLCTFVAPIPLLAINLIPKNRADQDVLLKETEKNFWCGVTFIVIMIATMFGTFYESIHTVRHAGDVYHR